MSSLDEIYNKLIQIQDELATAVASAKLNPKQIVIVNGLSDINNSLGSVRAGEFLALSSGQDPQDDDGTGTFISATGRVFGVDKYHIGGVKDGDLKWGVNSETGDLEAGDGAVGLSDTGISILESSGGYGGATAPDKNSINFVDSNGNETGQIGVGMSNPAGYRGLGIVVKSVSDSTHLGKIVLSALDPPSTTRAALTVDGLTQYIIIENGLDMNEQYAIIGGYQLIADDEVYSFTPNESKGVILIYDYKDSTVNGLIIYNATSPTAVTISMVAGSNTNVATGALTGTTGTDGKFTVSAHTDGKIYLESRRGGSGSTLTWNLFSGK